MKKFLLILFLTPTVLLATRHLNTVPHREWNKYSYRVRTVESLFGSTYRLYRNGKDTGLSSKHFEDLVDSF
jgi:hypothetical protein